MIGIIPSTMWTRALTQLWYERRKEMAYQRKTHDVWVVMTDCGYGWDEEYATDNRDDGKARYREYMENSCGRWITKVVKRRITNG